MKHVEREHFGRGGVRPVNAHQVPIINAQDAETLRVRQRDVELSEDWEKICYGRVEDGKYVWDVPQKRATQKVFDPAERQ